VRFTISIDEDKTVPLATLAELVTEQNVESVLLESMVESLDEPRRRVTVVSPNLRSNTGAFGRCFEVSTHSLCARIEAFAQVAAVQIGERFVAQSLKK
jgi:hypothetical protein